MKFPKASSCKASLKLHPRSRSEKGDAPGNPFDLVRHKAPQSSTRGGDEPALLTKQEAADRLAIGLRSLEKYIATGELPVCCLSARCVRIRVDDLDEFVKARRVVRGSKKRK